VPMVPGPIEGAGAWMAAGRRNRFASQAG
jgi:hypothetical protein